MIAFCLQISNLRALTVEQAVTGTAHKMVSLLGRELGKLGKR
jgi:hypothetical protein